MECRTCSFGHSDGGVFICRRYPPVPIDGTLSALWPRVNEGCWCGEYRENGS